ncbi:MAG: type II secretion system inner membrane protein GspF [Nitrospinota bacterium]|nr:type II secretion system inner membrane protein GspF [Nitrospinota bacterium]MDH5678267.1 type II secretion system inner membrane protein GspF [Nitrospinota bacterium]MDH5755483.1 type II secretion system inner membrane protein GspF [Nitrospinota bacterium]
MPVYEYKGYSEKGRDAAGIIDAENPKEARAKLRRQGILTVSVQLDTTQGEIKRRPLNALFNRIGAKEISGFTRQLETLQGAGIPLVESLDSLIEQVENLRFQKVITEIREKVSSGTSLADALAEHGSHFDHTYVSLVRAGESSGALGQTMGRLADFKESGLRHRSAVVMALVYPIIVSLLCAGVLVFLLGYVVPKTQSMFEDMDKALPLVTVILLAISGFLAKWWAALAVAGAAAISVFMKYIRTPAGADWFDHVILHAPVVGQVVRASVIGRFASTLGILLSSGVDMLEALSITRDSLGNRAYASVVDSAINGVTEGQGVAETIKHSGLFPPVTVQMIAAGERSGELERMLSKMADAYDFEMETRLTVMTKVLEPVLILLMGGVVLFVVLAILLPIFELSQLVH